MIDTQKYIDMYQSIKNLSPEDTLTLLLEASTSEEKNFWRLIGNFLLQQKQKEVIKNNLF